jgi:glyoxylase-like metal-dependent hydrolase (beta-lactamase superfamily II)
MKLLVCLPRVIAVTLALLLTSALADAQPATATLVASGVYVIRGSGESITPANLGRVANVAFVVGPRGVVVVESGVSFRHGEAVIAAVEAVTRRPIRLVIVTHAGQDVVFGAAAFQARGIPVLMHRDAAALMAARCDTCLRTLVATLGERAMVGSRVVKPDRTVAATTLLDVIGRPLRLIAPASASSPGALAVFDPATRTLIAGSLVTIDRIPDLRDADGKPWRAGLATLAATHCAQLIPALGKPGTCKDIAGLDRYFAALDRRVRALVAAGTGLADVASRAELPEFAAWDGYAELGAANANRAFLAVERAGFAN